MTGVVAGSGQSNLVVNYAHVHGGNFNLAVSRELATAQKIT